MEQQRLTYQSHITHTVPSVGVHVFRLVTVFCLNSAFWTRCLKPLSGSLARIINIFHKNLSEIRKFLSKNKPFHHASQPLPLCNQQCIPCKQQFKGCGKKQGSSCGSLEVPTLVYAPPPPLTNQSFFPASKSLMCRRTSSFLEVNSVIHEEVFFL